MTWSLSTHFSCVAKTLRTRKSQSVSTPDTGGNTRADPPLCVVVMGVSGSGKSTVGVLLANRLDVHFADGDDFHSPANVAKLSEGTPLTDEERAPWLEEIGKWLEQRSAQGAVVACSALKFRYREALRRHVPGLWLLHVTGSEKLLAERTSRRRQHFMPASLLSSQLAELEPPTETERAVTADSARPASVIVADFIRQVTSSSAQGQACADNY